MLSDRKVVNQRGSMRVQRLPLAGLAAVCTMFVLLAGCGQGKGAALRSEAAADSALAARSTKVTVTEVQMTAWPRTVRVQGSLLADERVVVGIKVAGRVEALGKTSNDVVVDLGSVVRAGEMLASLEPAEFDMRVQQAEAQLEQTRAALGLSPGQDESTLDRLQVPSVLQQQVLWNEARANWERAEGLGRDLVIPAEELQQRKALLDVAAARYESARHSVDEAVALLRVRQAELAMARQAKADSVVQAPFDGIVEQRYVAPGLYLQVGQPVVLLVKMDPLRFRAGVPEREASRLATGQSLQVMVEGEQQPLAAKITRMSPALDVANRSLTIEADLPNPGLRLRAGWFAEAEIVVDPDAQTLAVPVRAVREFAGVEKIWLVRDGSARDQPVQTGRRNDQWIEILEGVAAGDIVAVDDQPKQPGPVEVARKL